MDCVFASRLLSVHLCAPAIQFRNFNFSITLCKTHYEVLGVNRNATIREIKEAYFAKAMKSHPDNQSGDTKEFLELKQAYDILRRPADRRNYDNFLAGIYTNKTKARPQYHQGQNWNTYWQHEFYRPFRESDKARHEAELRSWRNIFWFTFAGVALITVYNIALWNHVMKLQKNPDHLIPKDEIAKCFLRQREFKEHLGDNVQLDFYARLLRENIEQAQQLKDEERRMLGVRNPFEIREEERWMAAVRAPQVRTRQRSSD